MGHPFTRLFCIHLCPSVPHPWPNHPLDMSFVGQEAARVEITPLSSEIALSGGSADSANVRTSPPRRSIKHSGSLLPLAESLLAAGGSLILPPGSEMERPVRLSEAPGSFPAPPFSSPDDWFSPLPAPRSDLMIPSSLPEGAFGKLNIPSGAPLTPLN